MNKNTEPKTLDASNVGDAAIYTDCLGNTKSVIITKVLPHEAAIVWRTGPPFSETLVLSKEQWGQLVLFPANSFNSTPV